MKVDVTCKIIDINSKTRLFNIIINYRYNIYKKMLYFYFKNDMNVQLLLKG